MRLIWVFVVALCSYSLSAQNVTLEGYVFETDNRGYLNEVEITVLDAITKSIKAEITSNMDGQFTCELPVNGSYVIRAEKPVFHRKEVTIDTKGKTAGDKVFTKIKLERQPGYLFDITLAPEREDEESPVDAITGAKIEVYNNTIKKEALVLESHPSHNFNFTMQQGNHYTFMIRKEGYFNKRMDAYVNVDGCILCFEGISDVTPGVSDNLTKGNTMGTLLANLEMKRLELNKTMELQNIYYDYNKWNIRSDAAKELDKLVGVLKDNPSLIVELGSHTDARGKDSYNLELSEKRANAAVEYIIEQGISPLRITAKGYGEMILTNKCKNGVTCSDEEHEKNRRTELKVVGFTDNDPYSDLSLKDIIEGNTFEQKLQEVFNEEVIEVSSEEDLPEEIRKQIEAAKNKGKTTTTTTTTTTKETTEEIIETSTEKIQETQQKIEVSTTEVIDSTKKAIEKVKEGVTTAPVKKAKAASNKGKEMAEKSKSTTTTTTKTKKQVEVKSVETEIEINNAAAVVRSLPEGYSGYMVEFFISKVQLRPNHKIFSQHGNITQEKRSDGVFAYMQGDFEDKEEALDFLKEVVIERYPNAKVIHFVDGKRKYF